MKDEMGERLKAYRNRAGMTLEDLAEKSNLSPSFLSKLEAGKVGISVVNLDKISSALGLDVIHLLKDDSPIELPTVTHEGCRSTITLDGNIIYESLGPIRADFGIYASLVTSQPNSNSGDESTHFGDELRYILKGRFSFWLGEEKFDLRPGDSLCHKANVPHRWENIGNEEGVFIVVSTMPY
jgi:transcriptional regulator with XRE-family HTH domain